MERRLNSKLSYVKHLFSIGESIPRIPLVFFMIAVVSILQIPSNYIIKTISLGLGVLLNEIVVIAGIPIAIAYILNFDLSKLFPLKAPKAMSFVIVVLLALPVAMLIDYGTAASELIFPLPQKYHTLLYEIMSFGNSQEFIFKLFLLCVVPGFCEEIFFRGFCQTSLEIRWGSKKAILWTALFFALLHGNPWYFHLYFLLGLFLSWIYSVSGSLWIPITCHIINNAWTYINHALGIEYPLKGFTDPHDLALISAGIILTLFFTVGFSKIGKQKLQKLL